MSAEHGPSNQESSASHQHEIDALAEAKNAEREVSSETSSEHEKKQSEQAETARKTIEDQHQVQEEPLVAETSAPKPTFVAKLNQHLSYKETMASVQHKLSPASRSFSKVIHAPAVEKASEALESTVFRPSVALGAVVTAFIVAGIFYFFARTYGYAMRGSEILISLFVGGLVGLGVEMISRGIRRPKH